LLLPVLLNDEVFKIRFRSSANANGEEFIIDDIEVTGEEIGDGEIIGPPVWPTGWSQPQDCFADPANDESPANLDLIGDNTTSAVGFASDADHFYFRERLDGDPSGPGGFDQKAWVVLFQTASPDYQFLLSVNGLDERVQLWQNTTPAGAIDFDPLLNDPAETILWEGDTATYARITTGPDGKKYVEWAIPEEELAAIGVNSNTTKFFATSADSNNFNKDFLDCYRDIITDETGNLKVIKVLTDQSDPTLWSFSLDGNTPVSADANGEVDFGQVASGPHQITENGPGGYQLVSISENCNPDGEIAFVNVPADDSITCTFTNAPSGSGSITVCKIVIDPFGNVVDGADVSGANFSISGFTPDPETSQGPPVGELPITDFTTPLNQNFDLLGQDQQNDAECVAYDNLDLGGYYYDRETTPAEGWEEPKYNDQFQTAITTVSDFAQYDGNLFDANSSDDEERNKDVDGHIVLTAERPARTLVVLNQYKQQGSITVCKIIIDPLGNIVDGADTDTTQFDISGFTPDPTTSQGAPVDVLPNSTFTTPLSMDSDIIAQSEGNDAQCVTYDGLELGGYYYDKEAIDLPDNWEEPKYNDQFATSISTISDLFPYDDNLFDGDSSNDEERNKDVDGHIVLTAERPDRTLVVLNQYKGEITILANKIVCDDEADLPNWGTGGLDVTSSTAADFLAAHPNCHLEDWDFQWGFADKEGQDGVDRLDGAFVGEADGTPSVCDADCGPNTQTGPDYNDWKTFSPSGPGDPATATITDLEDSPKIWIREVLQSGYIPFTNPPQGTTENNVSAEIYCHTDVVNYDNYDFIENPQPGETYYCVAFNSPAVRGATITVDKVTDPPGTSDIFTINLNEGINPVHQSILADTDSPDTFEIPAGTYNFTEDSLSGWDLTDISCSINDQPPQSGLTLQLEVGDSAFCTVTNTQRGTVIVTKFEDVNGDGANDVDESVLADWEIFLAPSPNTSQLTDINGETTFNDVVPGQQILSETIQDGWVQTNIFCDNETEPPIDNDNSHTVSVTAGETVNCFIGNQQTELQLLISKTNDSLGIDQSPGGDVLFTLFITAVGGPFTDVEVTDLLPDGFVYQPGSWTAESNISGPISIPEPTYASPGTWQIGSMQTGETITLTLVSNISSSQAAGLYKDVAWATGSSPASTTMLAQAVDPGFVDSNFVGTEVNVVAGDQNTASYNVENKQEGSVLGASTSVLPETGANIIWLLAAASALISGVAMLSFGYKLKKKNV
jgi:uncharacterized repeat protein (TIGR01451 family)